MGEPRWEYLPMDGTNLCFLFKNFLNFWSSGLPEHHCTSSGGNEAPKHLVLLMKHPKEILAIAG